MINIDVTIMDEDMNVVGERSYAHTRSMPKHIVHELITYVHSTTNLMCIKRQYSGYADVRITHYATDTHEELHTHTYSYILTYTRYDRVVMPM